jgi:hypothetical protein
MKSRLTLLLCGAALIAAAPLWADRASPGEEFANNEISVKVDASSSLDMVQPTNLGLDSHELAFSSFYDWKEGLGKEGRGHDWKRHRDEGNVSATQVPEAGSLPFVLLGLVSVGFLALRPESCRR